MGCDTDFAMYYSLYICTVDSVLYGYISLCDPLHITGTWFDFTWSRKRNYVLPQTGFFSIAGRTGKNIKNRLPSLLLFNEWT